MRKFRQAQLANSDDAAARVGDGTPPPRTDLTLSTIDEVFMEHHPIYWMVLRSVVTKPIDRIDSLREQIWSHG